MVSRARRSRWTTLATLAVVLACGVQEAAAGAAHVYFLRGEQVAPAVRPAADLREALAALLAGPSREEARRGLTSQLPAGITVLGAEVEDGLATVDVSFGFEQGSGVARAARLAQLVLTATSLPDVSAVRLLVEGRPPAVRFPGYAVRSLLRRAHVLAPPAPERAASALRLLSQPLGTPAIQRMLVELGYLPRGSVDGQFGPQTWYAVVAFQKWEGLERDGIVGPKTTEALRNARRPTPRTRVPGPARRVEVLLDRQLALVIRRNRVQRTLHVSTGVEGFETPTGSFRVFRKNRRSWSVPYKVWLPWASYFDGGVAFHRSSDVRVVPASHGCVRLTRHDARWLYERTPVGTRVRVLARS